jgi:hypothetical protein
MANAYALTIDIDAPADATWALVGDPVGVPRWFTKYVEAAVDDDIRTLTNANGGQLVERILDRDDAARRYSYTVVSGAPLRSHQASFQVDEVGSGSRVIWHTEGELLDPALDLEDRLGEAQREGLLRMKGLLEGTLTD